MGPPVKVAVVHSDNRRGAIAQALALIAPELRAQVPDQVLLKPNLVSHRFQLPSTHADALSATLDALFAAGAKHVTIAEGATDATAAFERFRFREEAWRRPVRFLDLNREEAAWAPLALTGVEGTQLEARLSRTVADAPCRVSLALAKTHVTAMVTLCLKNMLSAVHPDDRVMMHGYRAGNGYSGWKRLAVEWLKHDTRLVCHLTRVLGMMRVAQAHLAGKTGARGWQKLSEADRRFLRSVAAMNRNLVSLCARVRPHIAIVDGFRGMSGEGPRHGHAVRLGTAIAGTDPVAVDAVAAATMGFEPGEIGYFQYAAEAGLGVADLQAITVVGDPIARVRRQFARHSNQYVQQHWRRFSGPPATPSRPSAPGPHLRPTGTEQVRAL
jgi:uncharacterized protein (DUF362 family)